MANENQTATTILKYAVDQTSVNTVRRSIQSLKAEQATLNADVQKLGPSAQIGVMGVRNRFGEMRRETQYATNDVEKLRAELERVGRTRVAPQIDMSGATGAAQTEMARAARGPGALGRVGASIRGLPSMPIPGAGGLTTDAVGSLLRVSDMLISSIAGLGPVGIAAAAAVTAVTAAIGLYLAHMDKVAEAERKRLDIETEIFERARGQTREELLADITSTMREAEIAAARAQDLRRRLFATWGDLSVVEQFNLQLGGVGTRASEATVRWAELNDELTEQDKKVTDLVDRARSQVAELQNGATAYRDAEEAARRAAEAEKELAAARARTILAGANEARQNVLDDSTFAQMTSKQAEARIRQFETENAGLIAAMEAISTAYGATTDQIRDQADRLLQDGLSTTDALRGALQMASVPDELITDYLNYRDQLRQNREDIDRVNTALRESIRAREAEEAAIRAQITAIDQRIALEMQAVQLLGSGTVSAIDQRLDAINAEQFALSRQIPALQELAKTSEDGAKRLQAAQERMAALNNELVTLTAIRPEVAARQYREEVEKLSDALAKDVARIEAARDARIAQIRDDLADKEFEAERTRLEAISEARRDAAKDREKQEEDHQKNLRRIVQRANATIANAIASRDALAAFLAEQQKQQELEDEKQANADRLRAINEREKEVLRTIQKRYDDQLRSAREAADKAVRLERAKAEAEINTRRAAYNAELQQLQSALFAQYNLQQQFWNASLALAQRAVQQISQTQIPQVTIPNYYQVPQTGNAYQDFVNYQRSQGIPGFARGGYPPVGRPVLVGENGPELITFGRQARVFSSADTRAMMGGRGDVNVWIELDGKTIRATSRAEAGRYLNDVLKAAGVS